MREDLMLDILATCKTRNKLIINSKEDETESRTNNPKIFDNSHAAQTFIRFFLPKFMPDYL